MVKLLTLLGEDWRDRGQSMLLRLMSSPVRSLTNWVTVPLRAEAGIFTPVCSLPTKPSTLTEGRRRTDRNIQNTELKVRCPVTGNNVLWIMNGNTSTGQWHSSIHNETYHHFFVKKLFLSMIGLLKIVIKDKLTIEALNENKLSLSQRVSINTPSSLWILFL